MRPAKDGTMKRIAAYLILAGMLAFSAFAIAEGIVYTGTVSKTMTIRKSKSTSAGKAGSVEPRISPLAHTERSNSPPAVRLRKSFV